MWHSGLYNSFATQHSSHHLSESSHSKGIYDIKKSVLTKHFLINGSNTLLQKALLDFSCQDSSPVGGGNAHLSWFTALQ